MVEVEQAEVHLVVELEVVVVPGEEGALVGAGEVLSAHPPGSCNQGNSSTVAQTDSTSRTCKRDTTRGSRREGSTPVVDAD